MNKYFNSNFSILDSDEIIDIDMYTKDARTLILSEQTMQDIINNEPTLIVKQKYLVDAFQFLRADKLFEFRKLVCQHKNIINYKYDKTYLIHEACRLGNPDFVSLLLFLGAKCNLVDDHGFVAQQYAITTSHTLIIDILGLFGVF